LSPLRHLGCAVIAVLWGAVMIVTYAGLSLGDCAPHEPAHSQCEVQRTTVQVIALGIELAVLIGMAWYFYRRDRKDDGS